MQKNYNNYYLAVAACFHYRRKEEKYYPYICSKLHFVKLRATYLGQFSTGWKLRISFPDYSSATGWRGWDRFNFPLGKAPARH